MDAIRETLGGMVTKVCERFPEREALVHTEAWVRYNYSLLSWEIDRVARGLLKMDLRPGDRVGLWAPNIPEWMIALLALAKIGAITVPVDPGAAKDDVQYILGQSESRAVIMARGLEGEEYISTLFEIRDTLPGLENIFVTGDVSFPDTISWAELTSMGDQVDTAAFQRHTDQVRPQDPVAIMYTSGTTGKPKGVVLDHLGLINKSMCSTERQGITHEDRLCLFFPLFHMFGNTCIALAGLFRGAALVMPCQAFDPSRILQAIAKEKCTAIYSSPSMLIALLDHPEFKKKSWKTLTKGTIGGSPCPMELMRRLVEEIGVSHITVSYGITEASSWITMTSPHDPIDQRVSTIGTALPCNEIKIVDPSTGESLDFGRPGELCTRGYLMKEYYKMPAATAAAIDPEGWFHTGDLGEMDDRGYVRITGRLKDVIVRKSVEIYPVEVEEVIYGLPEVSEVQVFGFPDPKKGQEVAAWVKLKEKSKLTLRALREHARRHLSPEKVPHYFKIVTEFPMTRSGKVQKYRLAEMAKNEYTKT